MTHGARAPCCLLVLVGTEQAVSVCHLHGFSGSTAIQLPAARLDSSPDRASNDDILRSNVTLGDAGRSR